LAHPYRRAIGLLELEKTGLAKHGENFDETVIITALPGSGQKLVEAFA